MHNKSKNKAQAGFSLMELAIVLIVIGLLIGGVLKGRELIESARLKNIISDVQAYQMATTAFLDKYDALPGDFHLASYQIRSDLRNGNGDGSIEGAGLSPNSEALAFWSHLATVGLIKSPGMENDSNVGEFGKGAPSTALGGGFTIEKSPRGLKGHWLVLGKKNGIHGDGGLLTPEQAMSIDKKLDSGYPNSGKVRGFDGTDRSSRSCVRSNGTYNVENHEACCVLYFQL